MKDRGTFSAVSRQKLKKKVFTIWSYSRQLFSVCGVNGVSHIAQAKTNPRRVLWITLFTFSVIGWFYQTTTLLEYYYKYPTVVKIDVEKPQQMTFPAITLCNVNRIRRSEYCKIYPDDCVRKDSTIEIQESDIVNITFEFMKKGQKLILGHQLEDMVVSCTFTGKPRLDTDQCLKYFTEIYDPHLGNCFVLASDGKEVLKVDEPNAWNDIEEMRLILNVESHEYLDQKQNRPGLLVTVHEDMAYPHLFAHGMHVYPDHSYILAVEKITTYMLAHPYKTNCTDYLQLPFFKYNKLEPTPRICTVECLIYFQYQKCSHRYFTMDVVLHMKTLRYKPEEVTADDIICAETTARTYREYCKSLCGVPCHDVHYPKSVDSSPTSTKNKLIVNESLIDDYHERTGNHEKMDILDLKIHYQTMEHRIYRHSPEYTTEQLFSYLGGITGGWLGISLLEFCAFCESLLSVFLFSFRHCRPKSRQKKRKVKKNSAKKITPVYGRQCECHCARDFGSLLLALPEGVREDTPGTVQVVPFGYY